MSAFCQCPVRAKRSLRLKRAPSDLKGLAGMPMGSCATDTGDTEQARRESSNRATVRTWNVRTCERANVKSGHRTITSSPNHAISMWQHVNTVPQQSRNHQIPIGSHNNHVIAQSRHLNVERAGAGSGAQGGDAGAGARRHSFIRSPFVDSGDGTGTWNVRTCERGTCERGT